MPRGSTARIGRATLPQFTIRDLADEERDLAAAIAAELTRIAAAVGAEGAAPPRPAGLGARLLTEMRRVGGSRPARVVTGLPATGRPAARGAPGAVSRAPDPAELDPALLDRTRRLARLRLDRARPQIRRAAEQILRDGGPVRMRRAQRTTVQLRLDGGDVATPWMQEINIASPESLEFRWRTTEEGGARVYWELRGPVGPGGANKVLASGYDGDDTNAMGIGGTFRISLHGLLPAQAPKGAEVYHVRVLPLGRPSRFASVAASQGFVNLGQAPPVEHVAPEGIGAWSEPAVIRYGTDFRQGPQELDIRSVYRKAHFYLDWFRLAEDQTGPGDEEYHLSGFILEHTPNGAGVPVQLGPYSFTLDPDDRSQHRLGKQATFNLNYTDWPRTITAVISVLEEDDGGLMNDWHAALAEIATDLVHGAVAADLRSFLEEVREEIAEMQAQVAAELAAELAAYISALIAGTVREIITAWIALVVAWILANIRVAAVDDFYGMRVYGMLLPSNEVDTIVASELPDIFVQGGPPSSGGRFAGSVQPDGSFRLEQTVLQLLGEGGALEGSPVDGIVEVAMHWEFSDRVDI